MTTLLVQITDTHIREPGKLAYGRVDTAAYLTEAVASINRLKQQPQAIVMTGDLTDFGTASEYRHLAQLLAPLKAPVYLLPGNHDDPAQLRQGFPEHAYLGTGRFIQYTVPIGDIVVVALDTTVPGQGWGSLCRERLEWLATQLEQHRSECVIVAMHHPPFRTFIGHMDAVGLREGADELARIVSAHPQVERLICGHLHRSIDVRFGGTVASTCPSPAHQVSLDLAADAPSTWTLEPPGFKVHLFSKGSPLVSHLAYCGVHDGPYPFYDGAKLID